MSARREVHNTDALAWLRVQGRIAGASVITSLPDLSELRALTVDAWQRWFVEAAALVMSAVTDEGVAIFFQSDIQRFGKWVDKAVLCARAAEQAGMSMLFHKIVCREPPGSATVGRASYGHLLAFARTLRPSARSIGGDVLLDGGAKAGPRAMGVLACADAGRFILAVTTTRTIVDPFCGYGTSLAVANALGLDAVGVDLSARMCRRARTMRVVLP